MMTSQSRSQQVEQLLDELRQWAGRGAAAHEFIATFRARGYPSQVIADALVRTWSSDVPELQSSEVPRRALEVLLQQTLTGEHVAAQERMSQSARGLSVASVVLTAATVMIAVLELRREPGFNAGGTLMLDISSPLVQWGYFALAVSGTLWLGLGAYKIHVPATSEQAKESGARRWWQKWFNGIGAAVGWLAGWVVIVRWLGCSGFVCSDEPRGWTVLLAVIAFAGITGLLPLALMGGLDAVRAAIRGLISR